MFLERKILCYMEWRERERETTWSGEFACVPHGVKEKIGQPVLNSNTIVQRTFATRRYWRACLEGTLVLSVVESAVA